MEDATLSSLLRVYQHNPGWVLCARTQSWGFNTLAPVIDGYPIDAKFILDVPKWRKETDDVVDRQVTFEKHQSPQRDICIWNGREFVVEYRRRLAANILAIMKHNDHNDIVGDAYHPTNPECLSIAHMVCVYRCTWWMALRGHKSLNGPLEALDQFPVCRATVACSAPLVAKTETILATELCHWDLKSSQEDPGKHESREHFLMTVGDLSTLAKTPFHKLPDATFLYNV